LDYWIVIIIIGRLLIVIGYCISYFVVIVVVGIVDDCIVGID